MARGHTKAPGRSAYPPDGSESIDDLTPPDRW